MEESQKQCDGKLVESNTDTETNNSDNESDVEVTYAKITRVYEPKDVILNDLEIKQELKSENITPEERENMISTREQELVRIKQEIDILKIKKEPDTEKLYSLAQSSQLEPIAVSSDDENIEADRNSQTSSLNLENADSSEDEVFNFQSAIAKSLSSYESVPNNQFLAINWNKRTGTFNKQIFFDTNGNREGYGKKVPPDSNYAMIASNSVTMISSCEALSCSLLEKFRESQNLL